MNEKLNLQLFAGEPFDGLSPEAVKAVAGKDIILALWNTTGDKLLAISGQQGLTINRAADSIEINSKDTEGGWKSKIAGMKEWSIDTDGLYVTGDESHNILSKAFENGDSVCLKVINKKAKKGMFAMVTTKGPEIITNLCNGIVEKLPDLMAQGSTLINNLLSAITANLPSILSGGIAIVSALISGLAGQLPMLIPAAVDMITTLAGGLAENVGDILNAGFDLLLGLVDGIITALPSLISSVPVIISNLVNGIAENLPQIISTGMELLISLVTGLIDAIPSLVAAIPQIYTAFKTAFEETNWADIGSNLLEKIKEGFLKVKDSLINAVKDITDRIKSMFNIKADVKGGGSASVSVSTEQLAHGTDYWQGGFAYMNEGGRGELTYLPNGSQVIPHDISVKYAKEAARSNTSSNYLDVNALGEYIVTAVMAQGKQQADALEKGISGMRMTVGGREAGRFALKIGLQKAKS